VPNSSFTQKRYVSPKHLAQMIDALHKLYQGTFEELDVRQLLLGVREYSSLVAEASKQDQSAPSTAKIGMRYLADIAHAIAHPELKSRGPLRDYVKNTDEQMAKSHRRMPSRRVVEVDTNTKTIHLSMPPAIKPLPIYDVVISFFVALDDLFPFEVDASRLAAQAADVELCFFSILHFTQLPNLDGPDGSRHGYLAIQTWNGRYQLYAGVTGSKFEDVLVDRSENRRDPPFTNVFPVFNGLTDREATMVLDARLPSCFFATRNEEGRLQLAMWNSPLT
jgi:hypothetical protein